MVQFRRALELNPDLADAHDNLGIAYAQKGETAQAIAEFQKALDLNPGDTNTRDNLARARSK